MLTLSAEILLFLITFLRLYLVFFIQDIEVHVFLRFSASISRFEHFEQLC